jgi:hypothetical protein
MNLKMIKMRKREMGANIAHLFGKFKEIFSSKLASLLKENAIPTIKIIITKRSMAFATILLMV